MVQRQVAINLCDVTTIVVIKNWLFRVVIVVVVAFYFAVVVFVLQKCSF